MPEYLSPGVYVEEIDVGPRPIEGVSTSTAGFVGVTQRGPVGGLPRLVTSLPDFMRLYGGYLPETWGDARYLTHAVKGFFENGGQRLYIKRVPGNGAQSSTLGVRNGIVARLTSDSTLTSARLTSLHDISVGTNIIFTERVNGVDVSEPRTVSTYDNTTGEVTWDLPLPRTFSEEGTAVIIRPLAPLGTNILTINARDSGEWGNNIQVRFTPTFPARSEMVSNVVIPLEPLQVSPAFVSVDGIRVGPDPVNNPTSIDLDPGHMLQTSDVVEFIRSEVTERRTIAVTGDTISWTDAVVNDYSESSRIRIITAIRGGETTELYIPSEMAGRLRPNDTLEISGQNERVIVHASWDGTIPLNIIAAPINNYLAGDTLTLVSNAVRSGGDTVRVRSARNFYVGARVELDNGSQREYFTIDDINGNELVLNNPTSNEFELRNFVRLQELSLSVRYQNEEERIDQLETFNNLSMNEAVTDKYIITVVNQSSQLIHLPDITPPPNPAEFPTTEDGSWQSLADGLDGTPPPDEYFIGTDSGPGTRTGIQSMIDIDQVSIVAVPGKTSPAIQNALITHCELLKDRFAILDPSESLQIQGVQDFRNQYDSSYAALYYPWLVVRDPLLRENRAVPPSGHMAGIYARTDVERGVYKGPANTIIRGITSLAQTINKREQDILNPLNINVLRDFRADQRGYRVWGARTLSSDTIWRYINVRRLFLFIEESLDEGSQWVVFEPNDQRLWARVRQTIANFLNRVWRDGALMGSKPEEAYFVRCDRTTMTQDDIDNGRLIVVIGIAPVKPAEFVIIRIGQWDGGSSVEELS